MAASGGQPLFATRLRLPPSHSSLLGALTGTPDFLVTHVLFADDLSLMSNNHHLMQTMLNKLRACAQRKSLTVNIHKSEVMCFNSHTNNLPPLSFVMSHSSPTDSSRYLGKV